MRKVLLTALLAALPTAAVADWEFTKWGMTEAQVVAAAKGRTVRRTIPGHECAMSHSDCTI
jgi:hypothetical protein